MSEHTQKIEELSADQLSEIVGGSGNVHDARLEHLDNQTKGDSPIETRQETSSAHGKEEV